MEETEVVHPVTDVSGVPMEPQQRGRPWAGDEPAVEPYAVCGSDDGFLEGEPTCAGLPCSSRIGK